MNVMLSKFEKCCCERKKQAVTGSYVFKQRKKEKRQNFSIQTTFVAI